MTNQSCSGGGISSAVKEKDDDIDLRFQDQSVLFCNSYIRRNARRRLFSGPDDKSRKHVLKGEQNVFDPSITSFIVPLLEQKVKSKNCKREKTNVVDNIIKHMQWAKIHCKDYVKSENIENTSDFQVLIETILKNCWTVLFTVKYEAKDNEFLLSYQFLKKFRSNYMIAPIDNEHMMIMKTF